MAGLVAHVLYMSIPILIIGSIFLAVQVKVTYDFLKDGRPWVALGIWLIYPLAMSAFWAYNMYANYHAQL